MIHSLFKFCNPLHLLSFMCICMITLPTHGHAKTILIFCASSHIGKTLATDLGKQDDTNLILTARHTEKLKGFIERNQVGQTVKSSKPSHQNTHKIVSLDFSDSNTDSFSKALKDVELDGIVVMVPRPESFNTLFPSPKDWERCFQTSFINPLEALRIALPHLKNKGKIVVIGGISSRQSLSEYQHFGILRLMWLGQMKAMANQLAAREIHVNTIALAHTLTDHIIENATKKAAKMGMSLEEYLDNNASSTPLKRYAKPSEVSHIIQFLLSSKSDYITGTNIPVDGGYSQNY